MSLTAITEVALGIISIWVVLSLLTVVMQPWISKGLRKRASDIEQAIQRILVDPYLIAQFYNHPVIRGLRTESSKAPSRIPPQQFALTLFDITMTASTESSLIQQGILRIRDDLKNDRKMSQNQAKIIEELNLLAEFARGAAATEAGTAITGATLAALKKATEQFIEEFRDHYPREHTAGLELRLRDGLDHALNNAKRLKGEIDNVLEKQPRAKTPEALTRLRRGIAALSVTNPALSQTLNTLLLNIEDYTTPGETHLDEAKRNIEEWFEASISNKSGDLKRYSQRLALTIGFILAFLLNLDTLSLTIYFWRDAAFREFIMKDPSKFVLSPQDSKAPDGFRNQLVKLDLPMGWAIKTSKNASFYDDQCKLFPANNQAFGIPIVFTGKCIAPQQADGQTNILLKLIGITITALAARQGADFWFSILLAHLGGPTPKPAEGSL